MVNYSESFGARARCKSCGQPPKYLSYQFSATGHSDPLVRIKVNRKFLSRLHTKIPAQAFSYFKHPENSCNLSQASANVKHSKLKVSIQKGYEVDENFAFNFSFSCPCFKTMWVIHDPGKRKHIKERLSLKDYPKNTILV